MRSTTRLRMEPLEDRCVPATFGNPWPNGSNATFVNAGTSTQLRLQNPIGAWLSPPAWTLLEFDFAQPLTQAGGTVALLTNPNVAYTSYCQDNLPGICTPPPANVSQELFAMPPAWGYTSGFYFRVIMSGTITAQ